MSIPKTRLFLVALFALLAVEPTLAGRGDRLSALAPSDELVQEVEMLNSASNRPRDTSFVDTAVFVMLDVGFLACEIANGRDTQACQILADPKTKGLMVAQANQLPTAITSHLATKALPLLMRARRLAQRTHNNPNIVNCARQHMSNISQAIEECFPLLEEDINSNDETSFLEVGYNFQYKGDDEWMLAYGLAPEAGRLTRILVTSLAFALAVCVILAGIFWKNAALGFNNSTQTRIHIVSSYLEFIGVLAPVSLTLFTGVLTMYYRRMTWKKFHSAPDSSLTLTAAFDEMQAVIKSHSVASFLTSVHRDGDPLLSPIDGHVMTFEEWNDKKRDTDRPDHVRLLVKFFHVTKNDYNRIVRKNGGRVPDGLFVNDPKTLLKKVYEFRYGLHIEEMLYDELMDVDDGAIEFDGKILSITKGKKLLETIQVQGNERELELAARLRPCWINLNRMNTEQTRINSIINTYENANLWGSTILACGLMLTAALHFLDLSPECRALLNEDGSVIQEQLRVQKGREVPSPYIFHAQTWSCTHSSSSTIESGGVCTLMCQPGYFSRKSLTVCDTLGGGGISWTHLNAGVSAGGKGDASLDSPSCCIGASTAESLSAFTVDIADTKATLRWSQKTAFSHACGVNQTMFVQSCILDRTLLPDYIRPATYCDQECHVNSTLNCQKTQVNLVPTTEWQEIDNGVRFLDLNDLSDLSQSVKKVGDVLNVVDVPADMIGKIASFRLQHTNSWGTYEGDWVSPS